MKTLILAGGFGTRLRSVISDVPKPLVPVSGKPFLYWLLKNLKKQGIKEVILSLFHQSELIQKFLQSELLDLEIQTVIEPKPLGTGGSIAFAVNHKKLNDPFFVINGDTWLGSWVSSFSGMNSPAVGLVYEQNTYRYGRVEWKDQKVQLFQEKAPYATSPGWINAGVYLLQAADFQNWDGQPFSLEQDLLPNWAQQRRLQACPLETEFIDIGVPEDYHRFCEWHQDRKLT